MFDSVDKINKKLTGVKDVVLHTIDILPLQRWDQYNFIYKKADIAIFQLNFVIELEPSFPNAGAFRFIPEISH